MKKFVFTFVNIVFTLVLSTAGITQLYAADEPAAKSELEAQGEVKTTDAVEPATAATVPATPAGIESLRALVDEGSYKEAYAQSREMLFDFEGEPEFDLLYGTAALGAGESTESILIFERLVASEPSNLRYQLDLGRSYYQAGEKEKAKSTFESILVSDQEVPENIEVQALSYLDAIAAGSNFGNPEKAETLKGFIGLAGGYDSNANSASSADFIFPVFYPADPADPSFTIQTDNGTSEESTAYISYQFGGAYAKPLGERSVLDFKVAAQQRKNSSDLDYADNGATFIELANRWRLEKGIAMINARYTGVTFGGEDLYDYLQFGLNWTQPVAWQFADSLNLSLTSGSISYTAELNESRDIDPTILGVGVNKQVEQFVHGVSLNYGMDDSAGEQVIQNVAYKADWYSRNYWMLGYNLSYLYDSKTTIFGGLSYQSSAYEEEDPNFADGSGPTPDYDKRDGIQTTFVVGAGYALNKSLNFKGTISVIDATSDIDLYEYSRNKLEVGASYQL